MEKDYSLLRPFDLEAAKRGEKICWSNLPDEVDYIGVTRNGDIAYESGNELDFCSTAYFRMAPISWVEGRPVYRGDVLCWNKSTSTPGAKFTVGNKILCDEIIVGSSEFEDGEIYKDDGLSGVHGYSLTWQKPKTKREGWVNLYPPDTGTIKNTSHAYSTQEQANNMATINRVACCRIEWEE